jgi:hypothetical protein
MRQISNWSGCDRLAPDWTISMASGLSSSRVQRDPVRIQRGKIPPDSVRLNRPDQLRIQTSFPVSQVQPHIPVLPRPSIRPAEDRVRSVPAWVRSHALAACLRPRQNRTLRRESGTPARHSPRTPGAEPRISRTRRSAVRSRCAFVALPTCCSAKTCPSPLGPKSLARRVRRSLAARLLLPRADMTQQRWSGPLSCRVRNTPSPPFSFSITSNLSPLLVYCQPQSVSPWCTCVSIFPSIFKG